MIRNTFRKVGLLLAIIMSISVKAQDQISFLGAFDALDNQPTVLTAEHGMFKAPNGGHLQGIQVVGDRIFLSGSSVDQGYIAILVRDTILGITQFLGLKPISHKPLNHAGGFQITEGWLAVGCEDTKGKKRSLIALQDVSSAKAIAKPPAHDFERAGKPKESTAGAVGLLKRDDHFLLAIATWDAETIDFYKSDHLDPSKSDFDFTKWTTWDAQMAKRKNWVEKKTRAYQNIQLFEDGSGIYLIGTTNSKGNLAEVFRIDPEKDIYSMMTKVRSREFELPEEVSFRYGAGMIFDGSNAELWAVSRTLKKGMKLAVFD